MVSNTLKAAFSSSSSLYKDVTFINAKIERIHRWYPYLEGFAERFIEEILRDLPKPKAIYEPFAGSGTLPVYCVSNNINITYSEVNPFLQRLIKLKLDVILLGQEERQRILTSLQDLIHRLVNELDKAKEHRKLRTSYKKAFGNSIYFNDENFSLILKYRSFIESISNEKLKEIFEVAGSEALLHASFLKRAGDIRFKRESEQHQIVNFVDRVHLNLKKIGDDLMELKLPSTIATWKFTSNAKTFDATIEDTIDLIITSPPYLNGTNYIKNTKLELWFLGFLTEKQDLKKLRTEVVTSGINDVGSDDKMISLPQIATLLKDKSLWYDRRIPKMINDYFHDMDLVFENSYKYLKTDGYIFVDIGDSIYGGIHIKTDEILMDLLTERGFKIFDNLKLRERRSKNGQMVKQTLIIAQKS